MTLVRSWVVSGKPVPSDRGGDSYSRWIEAVDGILTHAQIPGTFAHADSQRQEVGQDDQEWSEFLNAVSDVFGNGPWTAKQVLSKVNEFRNVSPKEPIPLDSLPEELLKKLRSNAEVTSLSKSLGRWLTNRDGRWAGDRTVRQAGRDSHQNAALWRVEVAAK